MSNIRLYDKSFRPFISNEKIEEAIDKVAARINAAVSYTHLTLPTTQAV